ncbi:hypothetical protein HYH03_010009 [Edaphochlamys debaryana]|uniref:Uncharacterized protein n=1 Tax=Edaphochlamys debaryana TaxID=47281 RepID=A0A836BXV8_9CHLO|nr:hypothetical protein HYH03_010009 [Edaphochlamys debaryana]|eukprot:KAG2491638.1 hypothetical protein HYH03_010009 [Edaphochlamys debaryana]
MSLGRAERIRRLEAVDAALVHPLSLTQRRHYYSLGSVLYLALVSALLYAAPRAAVAKAIIPEDVCAFAAQGRGIESDPWRWGPHHICNVSQLGAWVEAASRNCRDCAKGRPVCGKDAPQLQIHTYFDAWSFRWRRDLALFKSFLLTQDLSRSVLRAWVDDPGRTLDRHPGGQWLRSFEPHVQARGLPVWAELLAGTPLAGHAFWGNQSLVRERVHSLAGYADVVRLLLLHRYGGLWVDTDVVLLRDLYPVTVQIGLQYNMRWTNNHVLYLHAGSPLATRMLRHVADMPYWDERTASGYVEDVCKPAGYRTAHVRYGNTDIYNICVARLAAAYNGTRGAEGGAEGAEGGEEDLDAVLFSQPLGWYDAEWPLCVDMSPGSPPPTPAAVEAVLSQHLALHTRLVAFPGFRANALNAAALEILDAFFELCAGAECVPIQGKRLIEYRQPAGPPAPLPALEGGDRLVVTGSGGGSSSSGGIASRRETRSGLSVWEGGLSSTRIAALGGGGGGNGGRRSSPGGRRALGGARARKFRGAAFGGGP